MGNYQFSVGIWAFGSCLDRFCENGYQKTRTFAEKVLAASKVAGLDGIEIHYNGDFNKLNILETKKIIDDAGLKVSAVNCEIFGDPSFRNGALTSRDTSIRERAIQIVKEAAEAANFLDASMINLWPGAEGSDYPFQIDYFKQWELLLDSLEQLTTVFPQIQFSLEYKPREPRIRSAISTVGKALLIAKEHENLGVTLDFGHSMMAKENPAEAAALLLKYKKLAHIHLNDNSRDWDDDLFTSSYHLWETLELLYYLQQNNYTGWLGFDITPKREDQIKVVEYCIKTVKRLLAYLDTIDNEKIKEGFRKTDVLSNYEYLSSKIFK